MIECNEKTRTQLSKFAVPQCKFVIRRSTIFSRSSNAEDLLKPCRAPTDIQNTESEDWTPTCKNKKRYETCKSVDKTKIYIVDVNWVSHLWRQGKWEATWSLNALLFVMQVSKIKELFDDEECHWGKCRKYFTSKKTPTWFLSERLVQVYRSIACQNPSCATLWKLRNLEEIMPRIELLLTLSELLLQNRGKKTPKMVSRIPWLKWKETDYQSTGYNEKEIINEKGELKERCSELALYEWEKKVANP